MPLLDTVKSQPSIEHTPNFLKRFNGDPKSADVLTANIQLCRNRRAGRLNIRGARKTRQGRFPYWQEKSINMSDT